MLQNSHVTVMAPFSTMCSRSAREKLRSMEATLPRFGFKVVPSQANFVWCRWEDRSVKPIYEALKNCGILVRYIHQKINQTVFKA